MQTLTDTALNVECFGQSVCGLQTVVLRGNSRAAGNMGLNEMAGAVVNQNVVLSIKKVLW